MSAHHLTLSRSFPLGRLCRRPQSASHHPSFLARCHHRPSATITSHHRAHHHAHHFPPSTLFPAHCRLPCPSLFASHRFPSVPLATPRSPSVPAHCRFLPAIGSRPCRLLYPAHHCFSPAIGSRHLFLAMPRSLPLPAACCFLPTARRSPLIVASPISHQLCPKPGNLRYPNGVMRITGLHGPYSESLSDVA
jgi:hypothetical protein